MPNHPSYYRYPYIQLGAAVIVPDAMEMIKTEKAGMEYGWEMGG